jgi:hypothetical protein
VALEVGELRSYCLLPRIAAIAVGEQLRDFGDGESRPLPQPDREHI